MQTADDLFRLSASATARLTTAGGSIPVLLIDEVYERPDEIREFALGLQFESPPYAYPGKIAAPPLSPSLEAISAWALRVANKHYLRRVPPLAKDGQQITAFRKVLTDFAIIDVHPDELSPTQRLPHVDPVPVFGLIYLNREERGGTLFFERVPGGGSEQSESGYLTSSNGEYEFRGRVEAAFNRMAIYPGFIPHSGEIAGDWIADERRFSSPRLTQRFVFFP
jgi:hypothetical protein